MFLVLAVAAALVWSPFDPLAAQEATEDSSFLLTATAPDRSPPPYVGNGWLGGTMPANGTAPAPAFLAGIYEEAPRDVPRIAAVPAWNAVDVHDGERWLNAQPPGALHDYAQTLDMRTGTVRTTYDWVDGGQRTSVDVEAFVSRAEPYLAAVRVRVVPHYAGRLRVAFPLAGWPQPKRLPLGTAERYDPKWKAADTWYPGHLTVRSRAVGLVKDGAGGGEVLLSGSPDGRATIVAQLAAASWPRDLAGAAFDTLSAGDSAAVMVSFDADSGRGYTFDKVVGFATSVDGPLPAKRAANLARAAQGRGFEALRDANAAAWARRWRTDVEIDGDPGLQRVVRAMLYQLLCSADSGTAMGIPPMGLSGGGYYGHVFWDSDTWMFPSLLATHPDVARSLVDFRVRTLGAARANARANGFAGAMYPWEADERGQETTPRFAVQNAKSEIHVTGDAALAAWQYYLATGDSEWLARSGYPIISATADFWVSRATHDTTTDVYHIRDVVSVDEGLIGVNDDGYTNAVARRNLETAVAAAARVGRTPNEAWTRVAARLHIAFDSARGTYRTYEGAPDSTLGSVTALLSYPLAMPMEPAVKRTNLEHAVRRMLTGERGAMMGSTLLSVVAAELGDRALVDTLLPASYQEWLKGPFLMISETPRNDAVSFVTGAGGFLQQVLYGWSGLRIGEGGIEPAFDPVLPSRVTRLALRNVSSRGRRFDVVVDSGGRRMVAREDGRGGRDAGRTAARAELDPRPARPVPRAVLPVLNFPEPGLDDSAAYQGYRTRFFRDSRRNSVQVYLDERSGRAVQVWADAANESIGFTARDTAGSPARLAWGSDTAWVSDSGAARTLTYRLAAEGERVEIGWFALGTMRVERDVQYSKVHLKPYAESPFRVAEESSLVATLGRLPAGERGRHLALLRASSVAALRSRLEPTVAVRTVRDTTCARVTRPSLDGRNRLTAELCVDAGDARLRSTGRTVVVTARPERSIVLTVRTATDAAPLTPIARDEIFNRDFLDFLRAARAVHDSVLRRADGEAVHGADSAAVARYRRLEREVRSVELLSSREKLLAGMPNYATYFGRDMMMTALMMRPVWTPTMYEHVIASVLRKLSPDGHVSHEEALAGQAIREHAGEYVALVDSAREASGDARAEGYARAREVLRGLQVVRENYHMLDGEFQLPVLVARYLDDPGVTAERKRAFLAATGQPGTTNLTLLVRELGRMTALTAPYARSAAADSLVAFAKLDSTHWRSASWRDSRAGYANGRFAMDINAIWVPEALRATERILAALRALRVDVAPAIVANSELTHAALADYARDSVALRRAAETWSGAGRHFTVVLPPAEIAARVGAKLQWMPEEERAFWQKRLAESGAGRDPLTFVALSLDSAARPIPVVNTDVATGLFLGDMSGAVLRGALRPDSAVRLLDPLTRAYPVGLLVSEVGPVVANDVYASDSVWAAFREDSYHGPRVVWGREVNLLLLGLTKQLAAAIDVDGRPRTNAAGRYVAALRDAIARTHAAVAASGFEHSELWSYRVEGGALRAERYGISSDLQLWSTADLAVQYMLSRLQLR